MTDDDVNPVDEQELRRMLHGARGPAAPAPGMGAVAVRLGRRRRAVRRAGAGAGTSLLAVGVVSALLVVPRAGDPVPVPATTGPTPAPAATGVPLDGQGLLVLEPTGVSLWSVQPVGGARAGLAVSLDPPVEGAVPVDAATTAGPTPTTCVVWQLAAGQVRRGSERELDCYAAGSAEPTPTAALDGLDLSPDRVALRADGSQIAVSEDDPDGNGRVVVVELGVPEPARLTWWADAAGAAAPREPFQDSTVDALAFVGDEPRLVVSVTGAEGFTSGLSVLRLDDPVQGWAEEPLVVAPDDPWTGSGTYRGVVSVAADGLAVALLDPLGEMTGGRAVTVDLATGRVVEELAAVDDGQRLDGVSLAGDAVVVTVTRRPQDPRGSFLRLVQGTTISDLSTALLDLPPGATVRAIP